MPSTASAQRRGEAEPRYGIVKRENVTTGIFDGIR